MGIFHRIFGQHLDIDAENSAEFVLTQLIFRFALDPKRVLRSADTHHQKLC